MPASSGSASDGSLVFLEGCVELVIVEQRLSEGAHGARVAGLNVDGALVGGDGVLRALQLVVGCAEGELHLAGAIASGTASMTFAACSMSPLSA